MFACKLSYLDPKNFSVCLCVVFEAVFCGCLQYIAFIGSLTTCSHVRHSRTNIDELLNT